MVGPTFKNDFGSYSAVPATYTKVAREAARIQSFPDDFEFKGSRGEKFKQIGNAVPVLFAEALAKSVKKNLDRLKK